MNGNFCIEKTNLDIDVKQSLFCMDSMVLKSPLMDNLKFIFEFEKQRTNVSLTKFVVSKENIILSGTFVLITLNAAAYCELVSLGGLQGRGTNCCAAEKMTLIFPLRIEDSTTVYFDVPLHK